MEIKRNNRALPKQANEYAKKRTMISLKKDNQDRIDFQVGKSLLEFRRGSIIS